MTAPTPYPLGRIIFLVTRWVGICVICGFVWEAYKNWNQTTVMIKAFATMDKQDAMAGKYRYDSASLEWAERKAKLKKWKGGKL